MQNLPKGYHWNNSISTYVWPWCSIANWSADSVSKDLEAACHSIWRLLEHDDRWIGGSGWRKDVSPLSGKLEKGKSCQSIQQDFVWKVILPIDINDRVLGKWSPNWDGPFRVLKVFSNNAYEIEEIDLDRRILRVNGKYLKKYKPTLQEVKIAKK